jgi:hypothetical protein
LIETQAYSLGGAIGGIIGKAALTRRRCPGEQRWHGVYSGVQVIKKTAIDE